MIIVLSAISMTGGTALTCLLDRFPERRDVLERCGGLMVIAGLVMIGGSLPLYR